jgi:thiamine-monophosphate kinase
VVSISLVGSAAQGRTVTRSGARIGDRLGVTGELGAGAGGLALTKAPAAVAGPLVRQESARAMLAAHARPVARLGEAHILAAAGATAMMDISDGLGLDLSRLCEASSVGARLDLGSIPVASGLALLAEPLGLEPMALALGGGEDFELLAAMPASGVEPARLELSERYAVTLTDVGEVVDAFAGTVSVDDDGVEVPLAPSGWDHFADG